jgi:asparagine synthase (glutamine-hydrolysing)
VADPSAIGLYFLAREARKSVKVVLSGEGSDELFGGYNIYLAPLAAAKIRFLPTFILKILTLIPLRGRRYAERALWKLEDWYIGNASVFKRAEVARLWKWEPQEAHSLEHIYAEAEHLSDSAKMQHIDVNTWLIGDILAKADKMTMAHSLELRVPFLDTEVAKVAATLPDRFKWHVRGNIWRGPNVTKYLLREAFHSVLPESVRNRKKLGFPTPVAKWFTAERGELYDLILENDYITEHLNIAEVKDLIAAHIAGRRDNSRKIYLLLLLAIWYNTFIRK